MTDSIDISADVGILTLRRESDGVRFAVGEVDDKESDPWVFRLRPDAIIVLMAFLSETDPAWFPATIGKIAQSYGYVHGDTMANEVARISTELRKTRESADELRELLTDAETERDALRAKHDPLVRQLCETDQQLRGAQEENERLRAKLIATPLTGSVSTEGATMTAEDVRKATNHARGWTPTHQITIRTTAPRAPGRAAPSTVTTFCVHMVGDIGNRRVFETEDGGLDWTELVDGGLYYKGESVARARGAFVAAYGAGARAELAPFVSEPDAG